MLLPLLSVVNASAQTVDAALQWQRIELGTADRRYPFAMYSNKPWQGEMARVRTVVLVFHGLGRNGDQNYEVIGAGHSQACMFGSKCGARLLIGLAEEQNIAGAACREPQ